jgi:hypothetical protein
VKVWAGIRSNLDENRCRGYPSVPGKKTHGGARDTHGTRDKYGYVGVDELDVRVSVAEIRYP